MKTRTYCIVSWIRASQAYANEHRDGDVDELAADHRHGRTRKLRREDAQSGANDATATPSVRLAEAQSMSNARDETAHWRSRRCASILGLVALEHTLKTIGKRFAAIAGAHVGHVRLDQATLARDCAQPPDP